MQEVVWPVEKVKERWKYLNLTAQSKHTPNPKPPFLHACLGVHCWDRHVGFMCDQCCLGCVG